MLHRERTQGSGRVAPQDFLLKALAWNVRPTADTCLVLVFTEGHYRPQWAGHRSI
jgi:hypothetical protein